jgi:putative ABC transport system substrate-binding protein
LDVEVVPAPITDLDSALKLLEDTPEDVDWLFLTPFVPFDPKFFEALAGISKSHQIGISWVTDDAIPGYLMGYGPNILATERQAAQIVDRILRGASPADLPVQTAENFLMVNLEEAAAINLEIPESILRQASTIVHPGDLDNFSFNLGG